MSTEGNGIDLTKSGWENPEGFQPRERDRGEVRMVKVCEAPGPDGWVCDLPPNHEPWDQHKADDGGQGIRWTGHMTNVQTPVDRGPVLIPAYAPGDVVTAAEVTPVRREFDVAEAANGALHDIRDLAEEALDSDKPARWALALGKIVEMTK